MYAGFLSLTAKEVDSSSQVVDLGEVRFELSFASALQNDTCFLMRISGGSRISRDHKHGGARGQSLRFYLTSAGLGVFFNQLVNVFDPVPIVHPPVASIPTVDAAGKPGKPVNFDLELLQRLPNNVNLYAYTLTPDPSLLPGPVSFKLTSTDGEGIVYLVDGMLNSNPPQLGY